MDLLNITKEYALLKLTKEEIEYILLCLIKADVSDEPEIDKAVDEIYSSLTYVYQVIRSEEEHSNEMETKLVNEQNTRSK